MAYSLSNLSCKRLEESYLPAARPEKVKKIRGRLRQREILKNDFIDEAVDFWKDYLPLEVVKFDSFLKEFLGPRLKKTRFGRVAQLHKRAAIIWWKRSVGNFPNLDRNSRVD